MLIFTNNYNEHYFQDSLKIPWCNIFLSLPVWAWVVHHWSVMWLKNRTAYMSKKKKILHFSVKEVSLFTLGILEKVFRSNVIKYHILQIEICLQFYIKKYFNILQYLQKEYFTFSEWSHYCFNKFDNIYIEPSNRMVVSKDKIKRIHNSSLMLQDF